jgi:ParB/RepB/Spo0J family partition protein
VKDIDDLVQSIRAFGLINPLTVRQDGPFVVLIAGERRLKAVLALEKPLVDVRFFDELAPQEAEIIELEENVRRKDLSWRDQVKAVGRIHDLYKAQDASWKIEQTADAIGLGQGQVRKILHVFGALDSGRIDQCENIEQAYNTLHRFAERKAESIVGDIIAKSTIAFIPPPPPPSKASAVTQGGTGETIVVTEINETASISTEAYANLQTKVPDPVLCTNFLEWIKTYSGPKFTLIHCDFPYGNYKGGDSQGALSALETDEFYDNKAEVYWNLLDGLVASLDNIMSYSAHMLFWFDMSFYIETVAKLRKTGLFVHDHPLIWFKTGGPGGRGVVPGTAVTYPRRTYDTALLCVRGNRPLAKPGQNGYPAPTVGNKIHPSQKSEPMLRVFLSMLVDETTTMLDPTCGSGTSLRAAEDLGAKYVLGLELDPNYAQAANTRTLQARVLRQAGMVRNDG